MNYSYKGKILISTPDGSGDIFSRSVVLIIDHDEHGTMGLILNKKSQSAGSLVVFGQPVQVYEGGPVEEDRIFLIVKGPKVTNEFSVINDEFYSTDDRDAVMRALATGLLSVEDIKVFAGCSSWAPMQLEGEIQRKIWTIVDVYNLDYTLPNDQNLWKNIMQNLGGEFLFWANAPEDVSLN